MEGAALAPPHQVARLRWAIAAVVLGCAGSLVSLAAFAKGTYRVGPLIVEMSARPATSGTTELALRPLQIPTTGHVEARTHTGFLAFRGTVVGITGPADIAAAIAAARDPQTLATYIRDSGQDSMRRFGIKAGLVSLAGAAAGGLAVSLVGLKLRRLLQGIVAGLVLVGVLGVVAWQTYDID